MPSNLPESTKYFPERLRQRSPKLNRLACQRMLNSHSGLVTQRDINDLAAVAFQDYNKAIEVLPFEQRPQRPTPIVSSECSLACHYASFYLAGRQIYDIRPEMLGLLATADYREVPASMFMLPFPAVYLHFGPQAFSVKGAPFEGALVTLNMKMVQIVLSTSPSAGYLDGNFVTHPTNYQYISFSLEDVDVDTPLGDVIDQAIAEERETLKHAAALPETEQRFGDRLVVDKRGAGSQEDLENFEIGISNLDDAMRLVVNTLIFITAYKEHVSTRWTSDTPEALQRLADGTGRPKRVNQAKAEVVENGYYRTHFVGDRFQNASNAVTGVGDGVQPHWRRAHWRLQRYGHELKERKLVLINQVLVNASKMGDNKELPGRITSI